MSCRDATDYVYLIDLLRKLVSDERVINDRKRATLSAPLKIMLDLISHVGNMENTLDP